MTRCDTPSDGLAEMLEPELAHLDTSVARLALRGPWLGRIAIEETGGAALTDHLIARLGPGDLAPPREPADDGASSTDGATTRAEPR